MAITLDPIVQPQPLSPSLFALGSTNYAYATQPGEDGGRPYCTVLDTHTGLILNFTATPPVFETADTAQWASYVVPMTQRADGLYTYSLPWPVIGAGDYLLRFYNQTLANPSSTDPVRFQQLKEIRSEAAARPTAGTADVFGAVFGDANPVAPASDPAHRPAGLIVLQPPTALPISADQLRRQCRIDAGSTSDETDDTLNLYIDAATAYAEQRLETSLMPQSLIATFYDWQTIDLRRGPVIGIQSVTDRNGMALTAYTLRPIGYTTRLEPAAGVIYPVSVVYRAGYVLSDGVTPAVPPDLRLAILMHAATLYTNRESISDKQSVSVPHALDAFYDQKSRALGVG